MQTRRASADRPHSWSAAVAGLLALLLAVPMVVHGHVGGQIRANDEPSPGSYVVILNDLARGNGESSDDVPAVARRVVDETRDALPSLRLVTRAAVDGVVYRHALRGFAVRLAGEDRVRIGALEDHPDVAFVAEDQRLELHAQMFQPGMERIHAPRNASIAINDTLDVGVDVDIAVLDTGIDESHPDLNVHRSVSFVEASGATGDPHGHGTHVAGVAGAIDNDFGVHGVAPGARLWSVKVVDAEGFAAMSEVIAGLDYVAANADQIDVVNMSFGGVALGDDGNCGADVGDPLHLAICGVVEAGVVVVVSAGNYEPYGSDASLVSPAAYDEVVTVSAVVETDGLGPGDGQGTATLYGADNSFAGSFSNYGWDVDLAAPGVEVLSTWPGDGYSSLSGTSAAAPHVAGAAAVWIAIHGKPTGREGVLHVRDELVRLAFPQFGPDHGFAGDKEIFAEPLLNVGALDPAVFDPVEPELTPDRSVYEYGLDNTAIVAVQLRGQDGQPLAGIPGNGFSAFLGTRQQQVGFENHGSGRYSLTVDISELEPGDHAFTAKVRNVAGFEKSAGCRMVVREPVPRLMIRDFAFGWPVMNHDWFLSYNPLRATLVDGSGAPVVADPANFETSFSGNGAPIVWTPVAPNLYTGLDESVTYGVFQSVVADIHSLPLGTYHADLTVTHDGQQDSATASFDVAYYDPELTASLAANLTRFDFTQSIAPPALNLTVDVASESGTGVSGLLYSVEEPFVVRAGDVSLQGAVFVEDYQSPGKYRAEDVDLGVLPHGSHELVARVVDGRGLEVGSNAVTVDVLRNAPACADPFAAEWQADGDGDGIRDECDNCPSVSNRSQSNTSSIDATEANLGDACKALPSLRVSSDAADDPDFFSIQAAVDGAADSPRPVKIVIFPGSGPYAETVLVDRGQSFRFIGRDTGSGPPVVEAAAVGESVFELGSAEGGTTVIRNLRLRGQGGSFGQRGVSVVANVRTLLSELSFERLAVGIDLGWGRHRLEHLSFDSTVGTGVRAEQAELVLEYSEFRGTPQAIRVVGPSASASVEHVVVVGNGLGIGIANDTDASSTLTVKHSTLVGCGMAVSGNQGGTSLAHSILWDNGTDVAGVTCDLVAWSDVQDLNCGGDNLSVPPLFVNPSEGDYRLRATSPLLDHGPDPAGYTGQPCTDLDGQPRLRDHDGNGLAAIDPGAYERQNVSIARQEVNGVSWSGPSTLEWTSSPSAVEYHIYRGPLSGLVYSDFGACADDLEAVRTGPTLSDPELPPVGEGFYYEITTEDASGTESTLGTGTCAERSNFTACP